MEFSCHVHKRVKKGQMCSPRQHPHRSIWSLPFSRKMRWSKMLDVDSDQELCNLWHKIFSPCIGIKYYFAGFVLGRGEGVGWGVGGFICTFLSFFSHDGKIPGQKTPFQPKKFPYMVIKIKIFLTFLGLNCEIRHNNLADHFMRAMTITWDHNHECSDHNNHNQGLEAYFHHHKFPLWWESVRDDDGGNLSVTDPTIDDDYD